MTNGNVPAVILGANRFSTRASRRYDAYKADMDKIEAEIIAARDKLVSLTNTKHILQLAGLSNYDYIK
tara:strand:- start:94 stop:297 length:204 start_codon:yes stop_codon:yes gene_type:complete